MNEEKRTRSSIPGFIIGGVSLISLLGNQVIISTFELFLELYRMYLKKMDLSTEPINQMYRFFDRILPPLALVSAAGGIVGIVLSARANGKRPIDKTFKIIGLVTSIISTILMFFVAI